MPNAPEAPSPRRQWWLLGGVAIVMVVAVATIGVWQGGDSGNGGSGCLTGLANHLLPDTTAVEGSDLVRARQAGYDDSGDIMQLSESIVATGVSPDPLTARLVAAFKELTENSAYEPGDVDCWLGPLDQSFVARGSFDGEQVRRSELAEDGVLQMDDGLLARSPDGDPDELLGTREQPATMRGLVETFDRHDAISFRGTAVGSGSDDLTESWAGFALARADDEWELLVVWSLPDAGAARAAEADVQEVLREGSGLGNVVEGDPAESLQQEGNTLWLRAPLADEPRSWLEPFRRLDPALLVLSDFGE